MKIRWKSKSKVNLDKYSHLLTTKDLFIRVNSSPQRQPIKCMNLFIKKMILEINSTSLRFFFLLKINMNKKINLSRGFHIRRIEMSIDRNKLRKINLLKKLIN